MRLTVGPLPSSVYWRRRAIVLGGLLLVVLLLAYTCSGTATSEASGTPTKSPEATAASVVEASTSASPDPLVEASPSAVASSSVPVVADPKLCTDEEISVIAKASPASMRSGGDMLLYLLVKNIGTRTCIRDIGPDLQELRIVRGTEQVWSSDDCDAPRGTNLKSFTPDLEMSFNVSWNGKYSSICTKTTPRHAAGPNAPAGTDYRLFARVGTRISAPVKITIT